MIMSLSAVSALHQVRAGEAVLERYESEQHSP